MRDKGIWTILVILIVFVVIVSCAAMPSAMGVSESEVKSSSATIYVPDAYPTIHAAVNAASPGDTIIVRSGTYKENVLLDKKLTLVGDALPTIDALGKSDAISIPADYCVVTGFRCVNAKSAGILVDSDWNRIENNTCEKNNYGICLKDSSNNTIMNNDVLNNKYGISLRYPPSSGIAEVRVNAPEYAEEGATFVVTLGVDSVTDLTAAQFDLSFDPAVIKVSDVKEGEINGEDILTVMWCLNPAKDTVRVLIMMPIGESVSGSGYLAEIEFEVKGKEGEKSELTFSNGELVGITFTDSVPMPEEIPAMWTDAEIRVGSKEEEGEKKEEEGEEAEVQVGSHNNFINYNTVSNNKYGIYLVSSSNNTLINNIVNSNNRNGFYLKDSSNNTIKNNEAYENKDHGIYLKRSTNNEITNNEIHESRGNGIYVHDSSNNNTIVKNEIRDNRRDGIDLDDSTNNKITSNEIYDNKDGGIYLRNSGNSTLTDNTISGSEHNFAVYGKHLSDYIQSIDTSNKVEGKPVYYLVNKQDQQIPGDAGYVGAVNSTNITVSDLALTNNGQGVLLAFSKDSRIENINASDNKYGIYLDYSSNNVLMNNKVSNNDDGGIYLRLSVNNEIKDNKIRENKDNGICIYNSSNNNTIQNNEIRENRDNGICVYDSSNNNTIQNNEVCENNDDGIYLKRSTNNEITNNKIHENRDNGIYAHDSTNSMITSNKIYDNKDDGIYLRNSGNSTLANNTMSGNEHNFAVYGKHLFDYIQSIDTSNKVEGKPVYYLVNKKKSANTN